MINFFKHLSNRNDVIPIRLKNAETKLKITNYIIERILQTPIIVSFNDKARLAQNDQRHVVRLFKNLVIFI